MTVGVIPSTHTIGPYPPGILVLPRHTGATPPTGALQAPWEIITCPLMHYKQLWENLEHSMTCSHDFVTQMISTTVSPACHLPPPSFTTMNSSPLLFSSNLETSGSSDTSSFSSRLSVPQNTEFLPASDMGLPVQAGTRDFDRFFFSSDNGARSQPAPMFSGSSVCILFALWLVVYII